MPIATHRDEQGVVRTTWLALLDGAGLAIGCEEAPGDDGPGPITFLPLPRGALTAIFARYGKPLDEGISLPAEAPTLDWPPSPAAPGQRLRALRYRPWGWVLPLDYLVLEPASGEPLCAPAPLVAAALLRLARA